MRSHHLSSRTGARLSASPNRDANAPPASTSGLRGRPSVIRLGSETRFGLRVDARETNVADPVCMKTTQISHVATPIVVEGLTKRYGSVKAVDELSFAVRAGAVTGFLGPNGAGKTTTLKMIVGLARPTAGRALL